MENLLCVSMASLNRAILWDAINLPGYRVIRIDLIGHGDSDIPDEDKAYTIPQ